MDEGPRIKWISKSAIKRTEQDKKRKTSLQHYEINIEEKASPAKKGYVMFRPLFGLQSQLYPTQVCSYFIVRAQQLPRRIHPLFQQFSCALSFSFQKFKFIKVSDFWKE